MQSVGELNENHTPRADTYLFSEVVAIAPEKRQMALLALSHTKLEHRVYEVRFAETRDAKPGLENLV